MHAVDRGTMSKQFLPGSRTLDAPCYPTQFGCDQAVAQKYGSGCPGCGKFVCTCADAEKP